MSETNIVILGGGVGGTVVANLLARKLRRDQAQITVIEESGRHAYRPGWLFIPFGGAAPERLERPERRLLRRRVRMVNGQARRIDRDARLVELADGRRVPYTFLVIATGARLPPETLTGFREGAEHFYSAGRILVGVADIPYKCPPAPLEFAFLLDDYLREGGLRERSEIIYLSPINRVFTIESVAEFVTPLLDQRGIGYELFFNTESIDPAARTISSLEGETLSYDLLVLVPPHRGAAIISESGLGDAQGWVPTNRETLESKADPRIYAIGDATDVPVSKSGSAAHFEARVVASRLASLVRGETPAERYEGQVMCFLETGRGEATQLAFDYTHPPQPPRPSRLYHYEKAIFNKLYWYLVPPGRV